VNTGFTKSQALNGEGNRGTEQALTATGSNDTEAREISPFVWRIASLAIVAGAAFIRLYELGLKPMHHDEGVNGFFLTTLYRTGVYHYNPENYHGPTLYYFALIITKLNGLLFGQSAGLSTVAVRLVPVIFGVATVCLALRLRRNIGTVGALAAAAFIAVSPGNVYISRYFIHEAQFVFFTLAIVVAAVRYYETADPLYLLLASLSAALLFATKETAFISIGVLGLALAIAAGYVKLFRRRAGEPIDTGGRSKKKQKRAKRKQARLQRFGGVQQVMVWSGAALLLFIFINILFYSSFFTYWKGVNGALESLQVWAKTSTKDHTQGGVFSYLQWLMQEEAPLLILGTMGALIALIRRQNRFAIFAGAWAFGMLAAYSLIPYKTPWLMLNFTVPLAILGAYAVNEIHNIGKDLVLRIAAIGIAVVALTILTTQSVILNFHRYDDDRYPYVYAHTTREFLAMVNKIEELATRAPTGKQTGITITSPDYWPMPWYLRAYEHAGFFGRMAATTEPIVVGKDTQESMLFRDEDLTNVSSLVTRLKNEQDPLAQYLVSKLSPETLELVARYTPSSPPQKALTNALVDDLNRLINDPSLYQGEFFSQASLRPETRELIDKNPQGEELVRLNRMLLEDAFPTELAKNLPSMLGKDYRRIDSGLNPAGTYALRPGVNLVLYARNDLAP